MRTELPAERLHRRLGARPDAAAPSERDDDDSDADTDPNSLLPRWVPDGSTQHDGGWLAKVRADPDVIRSYLGEADDKGPDQILAAPPQPRRIETEVESQ